MATYTGETVCPALILATAGYPVLADRIRIAPDRGTPSGPPKNFVRRLASRLRIRITND